MYLQNLIIPYLMILDSPFLLIKNLDQVEVLMRRDTCSGVESTCQICAKFLKHLIFILKMGTEY